MDDLTNLPSSVRSFLTRVGSPDTSPEAFYRELALLLARSYPDLCAALLAAKLGASGYEVKETEEFSESNRTTRRIMGVQVGHDVQTTRSSHTKTRQVRFINGRRQEF